MLGQQGPAQGRASNGAGHSAHTVPQPQLRGGEALVQQDEWEQAASTLLTCWENVSSAALLPPPGASCSPTRPLPCLS